MWLNILMSVMSSSITKQLIGIGIKKLLAHASDGITKDIAIEMLDGIAMSQANRIPEDAFKSIKEVL